METKTAEAYKDTKVQSLIETTDQLGLIIMLYDKAISSLENAKKVIVEKDYEQKNLCLNKANDIVFELLASLNREKGGEIAASLSRLYNYVIGEILKAETTLDPNAIDNAREILSELRDSWKGIRNKPGVAENDYDAVNITSGVDLAC